MFLPFLIVVAALVIPNSPRIKEYPKTEKTIEVMYIRVKPVDIGGMITEVRDTLIVYEEAE